MNVGRVGGLYESGLEQGLIPLLPPFPREVRIGKEAGRGGGGPRQIHRTRLLAATRLSSQLPTLLFKRTQTHGRWKANTERKGS
jgi:hypothetical protein